MLRKNYHFYLVLIVFIINIIDNIIKKSENGKDYIITDKIINLKNKDI